MYRNESCRCYRRCFLSESKTDRSMRINYSNMPDGRIVEGIQRMAKAIKECM